ncbi:HAMP domain-containing sensor histidine kinase [Amycolatopsis sp.]|uniref:HAMP domain-containing sensor histidine kinase n=1 Tax=Amycolatopsis sp. TaxID=37632 RepID=UPI002D7F761B|nr:HAMP domain-containing sensor histidine kinase [Amycolatopsis sp.]HET6711342.1 HAMP domain-containing sensor histidine kinase [Amycolatopsis sp.]
MTLRGRVAAITAGVVAAAVVGIAGVTWFATRHHLLAQLDQTLLGQEVPTLATMREGAAGPTMAGKSLLCDPATRHLQRFLEGIQLLRADGTSCVPGGVDAVVTTPADHAVTAVTLRDGTTAAGIPVRVVLRPAGDGDVVAISRSLEPVEETLAGLRTLLFLVCLPGVVVAGATGLLLARRALAPLGRLTAAAEHIARTEDLDTPVPAAGRDEAGLLGRAFTAMTAALRESRRRQRELVNDAAHELRTPLTSLRTNIDLLARSERTGRALPPGRRTRIVDRLQVQATEFGDLVGELVQLARDTREPACEEVPVAAVVRRAVARARSRTTRHDVEVELTPWSAIGDAAALERAVLNVLDNAIKFSPPGSVVRVHCEPGLLVVTDQGPGVPAEDRDRAFARFWRAPAARALPGSGLGLAIVADTVRAHGGRVRFADPPPGWGACVHIELPRNTRTADP